MDDVTPYEERSDLGVGGLLADPGSPSPSPFTLGVSAPVPSVAGLGALAPPAPSPVAPSPLVPEPGLAEVGEGPPGELLAVEPVGPDVARFSVRPRPGLTFRPGQNVKVGLPGGRRHRYTIASGPHEPVLELCIERVPGGRLTPALFDLRPGAVLEVADRASGSLTFDDGARHHLMVATVTGIAPFRAMVRDLAHRGVAAEVTVLHGASYADELPYRDELEAFGDGPLRVRYVPTVSRPGEARNAGWQGSTGRVDDVALREAAGFDPATTRVYACGNGGMVSRVATELCARGFSVATESYD